MQKRYRTVDEIRNRLPEGGADTVYPMLAGALTAHYKTVTGDFEELRELAREALTGSPAAFRRLRHCLDIHAEAAYQAAMADEIEARGICEEEADRGGFHSGVEKAA